MHSRPRSDPANSGAADCSGNSSGKLVFCYDSTGSAIDSALIPLLGYTFLAVPDGSDIVVNDHANGLIRFT